MLSNDQSKAIFEQLRNGETIAANNPEAYKLRDVSYATRQYWRILSIGLIIMFLAMNE